MKHKPSQPHIEQLWQDGIERALQDQTQSSELDQVSWSEAAGLHLKSGIRGGLWSATCGNGCTANCSNPPNCNA